MTTPNDPTSVVSTDPATSICKRCYHIQPTSNEKCRLCGGALFNGPYNREKVADARRQYLAGDTAAAASVQTTSVPQADGETVSNAVDIAPTPETAQANLEAVVTATVLDLCLLRDELQRLGLKVSTTQHMQHLLQKHAQ